jgi:riboflavin kinase / FMN adenylyltransferase
VKTLVGLGALRAPSGGTAVTIGTFDGVHLGHRALLAHTIGVAGERGLSPAAVTWDRHPSATLRPERTPPLLTSPARKVELLEAAGLELLAVLPFDAELASWPPDLFATRVLAAGLGARCVLVGQGWRFGKGAAGDVELLGRLGQSLGFEVRGVELSTDEGGAVSSSRVRELVAAGALERAAELLSRPYDLDAVVVKGDGRGTSLGYPTANLAVDESLARPPIGVYAGRARVDGMWYPAATNIGVNPQFGGERATTPVRIESFLLDFEGDLYGAPLRLELWQRLRDERRFETVEDLVAQMAGDVDATRRLVG